MDVCVNYKIARRSKTGSFVDNVRAPIIIIIGCRHGFRADDAWVMPNVNKPSIAFFRIITRMHKFSHVNVESLPLVEAIQLGIFLVFVLN